MRYLTLRNSCLVFFGLLFVALCFFCAPSCGRKTDRDAGRVMTRLTAAVGAPVTFNASWYLPEGTDVTNAAFQWTYEKPPSDVVDVITSFETPLKYGMRYGARIRGYLHPPVTGDYTFWIASHDQSELWLSDCDDCRFTKKIAEATQATEPKKWDKTKAQKSEPIKLEKGKRYYVEALHKQGSKGPDHMAVAWQFPGTKREVIDGKYLSENTASDVTRMGGLSREVWKEMDGVKVVNLTQSPRLRDDLVVEIAGVRLPVTIFTPPAPGDYLFLLTVQTAQGVTYHRRLIVSAE